MGGFKIPWGFNLPYRGGSVFNKGVQYTMDVNRPRVQFTMGFKIPYDTGIHDANFASKFPFKFLEFKFFDRVYHTRNLNQKT